MRIDVVVRREDGAEVVVARDVAGFNKYDPEHRAHIATDIEEAVEELTPTPETGPAVRRDT